MEVTRGNVTKGVFLNVFRRVEKVKMRGLKWSYISDLVVYSKGM